MRLRHVNYVITRPAISFILLYGAPFPSRITSRAILVSVTLYDEGLPRVAGFFSVTVKMDFFSPTREARFAEADAQDAKQRRAFSRKTELRKSRTDTYK